MKVQAFVKKLATMQHVNRKMAEANLYDLDEGMLILESSANIFWAEYEDSGDLEFVQEVFSLQIGDAAEIAEHDLMAIVQEIQTGLQAIQGENDVVRVIDLEWTVSTPTGPATLTVMINFGLIRNRRPIYCNFPPGVYGAISRVGTPNLLIAPEEISWRLNNAFCNENLYTGYVCGVNTIWSTLKIMGGWNLRYAGAGYCPDLATRPTDVYYNNQNNPFVPKQLYSAPYHANDAQYIPDVDGLDINHYFNAAKNLMNQMRAPNEAVIVVDYSSTGTAHTAPFTSPSSTQWWSWHACFSGLPTFNLDPLSLMYLPTWTPQHQIKRSWYNMGVYKFDPFACMPGITPDNP